MPLTTANFWFEELQRVKRMPVGDPEILTRYPLGNGQPQNIYFLVRRLPMNEREEPLGVYYFYNMEAADGGSAWICIDFITAPPEFRDAGIELVHRLIHDGLILDDGTVLMQPTRTVRALLPVMDRYIPPAIKTRDRGGLRAAPERRKAVIAAAMSKTFIADEMDHPLTSSVDIAISDLEGEASEDPKRITLEYVRRG